MPTYVITAPDGREYEVTAPDGASQEDVLNYAKQNYQSVSKPTPTKAEPAPQTPKRSLWEEAGRQLGLTARAGITGATDIASLVLDPAVGLVNKAAGTSLPAPSASLQQLMTRAGLPEPENKLERAVQRGAAAVAGVGSQAKLAAQSGVQALKPFTKELAQQGAAGAAAATTAQAVSENMQESGASPTATLAATLASGVLAGGLGAKTVRGLSKQKLPVTTIDDVKQEASRAYTRVEQAGVSVKPLPLLQTVDDIEASLVRTANFNPVMDSHKPVKQVLDQMRQMIGSERVSFTKMDQLRQTASNLARESTDPATRRLANLVVEGVDNKMVTLQPQDLITGKNTLTGALRDVKEARDAWKRSAKASTLEKALDIAEARALAPTSSEGDLIRTQFKALASNPEKMRLFSKDEQTAIRRVVSGNSMETLLALAAKFNPERNQFVAGAQVAGAFNPVTSPVALASAAGGFAADKALGALQRSKAEKAIASVLTNTPLERRSVIEANLRALSESRPGPEKDKKESKKKKKEADVETIMLDGVEIPVDRLGIVTGRDTPTLPPEFFRNEAAMRRAMQ